jgi:exosortase
MQLQLSAAGPATTRTITAMLTLQIWPILVTSVTVIVVYTPVLSKLVKDWWNLPDYSHGFLIPAFCALVLWRRRTELAQLTSRPSWNGLWLILLAMAMMAAGQIGAELFISRVSLVVLIAGLVVLYAGWSVLRAAMFPWAILLLAIPIPAIIFNQITFPLQLVASRIAGTLLPLADVPVLRQGNVLILPSVPLEVAEACSGVRSLIALVTLSVIYGYVAETKRWRQVALLLSSIPIAVMANAMRIMVTGVAVQCWNPEKALGLLHSFSGVFTFLLALILMYGTHGMLRLLGENH